MARGLQSQVSFFMSAFKYDINVNEFNLNFPTPTDLTLFDVQQHHCADLNGLNVQMF